MTHKYSLVKHDPHLFSLLKYYIWLINIQHGLLKDMIYLYINSSCIAVIGEYLQLYELYFINNIIFLQNFISLLVYDPWIHLQFTIYFFIFYLFYFSNYFFIQPVTILYETICCILSNFIQRSDQSREIFMRFRLIAQNIFVNPCVNFFFLDI